MVGTILRYLDDWYRDERSWSERLLEAWASDPGHGAHNRAVLGEYLARWNPEAEKAVRSLLDPFTAVGGSVEEGLDVGRQEFNALVGGVAAHQ